MPAEEGPPYDVLAALVDSLRRELADAFFAGNDMVGIYVVYFPPTG